MTTVLSNARQLATTFDALSLMACIDLAHEADDPELAGHARRDLDNLDLLQRLDALFPGEVWTRHRALVTVKGGYDQKLAKQLFFPEEVTIRNPWVRDYEKWFTLTQTPPIEWLIKPGALAEIMAIIDKPHAVVITHKAATRSGLEFTFIKEVWEFAHYRKSGYMRSAELRSVTFKS